MIPERQPIKDKGGRPKKLVKKERTTSVRFTHGEYKIVENRAEAAGYLVSAYIREISIHGKVIERMNEEERLFVRQLVGMSGNLNQLARKAHREGIANAALDFEKYKCEIDVVLKKLKIK